MSEPITAEQFHDASGVEDWRFLANSVGARFHTGSFPAGVALVGAIGQLAGAVSRPPDVDLRPASVTVWLLAQELEGLQRRHIELARQISAAARELGVRADPNDVQDVQLTIDALAGGQVRAFWRAVLGYREVGDDDLLDPHSRGPGIWFQQMDVPRSGRNRIHVDVFVPHDQAEARVAAAIAAGGHLVTDEHAPTWWALTDPEGNEVDIATCMGRG
jgi:4a-hydroxytetrahydrobiopterin dehydratase